MNEIADLAPFQPPILALFGGLLQYARGNAKFPEWGYHVIAVLLACGAYVLFHKVLTGDPRLSIVYGLLGISSSLTSIWGGTFAASSLAKAGVGFVPVTNSNK